jgi:hypothetical protein
MRLDAIGCDWMRLDAIGCDWMRLDAIGCDWMRLDAIGCDWMRLGACDCTRQDAILDSNREINKIRQHRFIYISLPKKHTSMMIPVRKGVLWKL